MVASDDRRFGSDFRREFPASQSVSVSAVVPALSETKNLPYMLPRIPARVDEVVLVDGNSTDAAVAVARELMPDIGVVKQDRPGKGAALCAGRRASRGDIIVIVDADGSADPAEVPAKTCASS